MSVKPASCSRLENCAWEYHRSAETCVSASSGRPGTSTSKRSCMYLILRIEIVGRQLPASHLSIVRRAHGVTPEPPLAGRSRVGRLVGFPGQNQCDDEAAARFQMAMETVQRGAHREWSHDEHERADRHVDGSEASAEIQRLGRLLMQRHLEPSRDGLMPADVQHLARHVESLDVEARPTVGEQQAAGATPDLDAPARRRGR